MKTTVESTVYLNQLNEGDKFTLVGGMPKIIYVFTRQIRVKTLVFESCNSSAILRLNEKDQFNTRVNIVTA